MGDYEIHLAILQKASRFVDSVDPLSKVKEEDKLEQLTIFYDDFLNNQDIWFEVIFCPNGDPWNSLKAVATLECLAHLHRCRGNIHRAKKILHRAMKILECLRVQTYDRAPKLGDLQIKNYRTAAHKTHMQRKTIHQQLGNQAEATESCRWVMEYELENITFEERILLPLIYNHIGREGARTLTKAQLREIDDEIIWENLQKPLEIIGRSGEMDLKIRVCGGCAKKEKKLKKFKKCARCLASFYCSEPCQRKHWPAHKRVCKPPAVVPRKTGPYDLVHGGVTPDGKQIVFKVFRDE